MNKPFVTLCVAGLVGSAVAAVGVGLAEASSHSHQNPQSHLIVKGASKSARPLAARTRATSAAVPDPTKKPNVAYDPFCYPVDQPPTGSETNDYGWATPGWTTGPGNVVDGLDWPGGGLTPSPQCNALGPSNLANRAVATPVMPSPGGSLVLRALFESSSDGTPSSQATLGAASGGANGAFTIGDLPETDPKAANWGMQTDGGNCYSNVPVKAGQTVLLVAQLDFGSGGDTANLWVQVTPATTLPATPNCTIPGSTISKFSGVFYQGGAVVDEIGVDYTPPAPPSPTQICVSKFDDTNGNGAQDSGESNLSGWTFTVKDSSGNTVGTLTSAAKPVCLAVKPGTYSVTETQQTGWVAINPSSGTQTVTVAAGQTQTLTFANQQLGRLCVVKFSDNNGNGSQDSGEPTLSGWAFTVKDSGGNTVGTLTSAANPVCMAVKPGTYSVTETQQAGWVAINPSSGTQTVTVAEGQTQTLKFANQQLGQICVQKYWDKNGNGTQNSGEPFLSGWSFTVNTSPLSQIVIGKGKPCERVRPGTYTVTETQKPGWIPTDPTSGGRTVTVAAGQTTTLKFGNYQPRLDHYECYWTSPHRFPNRLVGVRDQFNGSSAPRSLVVAKGPLDTLCNPASKNQERVPNPLAHLFCYPVVKGTPFIPKTVMTTNQFGQLVLRIIRPRELCLPTAKTLRPQVRPQRIPTLDHYLCYDIRQVGVRRYPTVLLVDEFGARRAAVLVADRLCAPAQKFVQGQKPSVRVDPVDHLVCYTIRMPFEPRAAYIRNQFEYRAVKVIRGRWLCVPSIKKVLGGPIMDCRGKLRTYTQTDGRPDNFQTSDGPEPATEGTYDQTVDNQAFLQRLVVFPPTHRPDLRRRMCSVTVEFTVKGLYGLPGNDAVSLSSTYGSGTASWSQYLGAQTPSTALPPLLAGPWSTGRVATITLAFGPSGGLLTGNGDPVGAAVFNNFNLSGILNFGVEDDSAVDYVKFTVKY